MHRRFAICLAAFCGINVLFGTGQIGLGEEPSATAPAEPAKKFTIPGKFSINDPGEGYQWSFQREMEHQGVKMRWYALSKEGSSSAIVLGVEERTADSDPARLATFKGHFNGTWEGLRANGYTDLKGRGREVKPPIPGRIEFAITGKNPEGGDFFGYVLTVFGRSVYSLQASAPTREDARRMYEIASSFQESPAH